MSRRWIFIIVGAIVVLTALAIWKSQSSPKGIAVDIATVSRCDIQETVAASGRIFPEKEVAISSDVSGEIVELFIQEGDSVTAGQLLARVDPDALESAVERGKASVNNAKAQAANIRSSIDGAQAGLAQAQAQETSAEAQLTNAEAIYQRNKLLYEQGVISEQEYDQALSNVETQRAALRSAQASVASAQANVASARQAAAAANYSVSSAKASLRELQTNLNRSAIYAPVSGIISRLNVEQGERVVGTIQMTGTEILRIADMSRMEVQVDVNENDVLRVSVGDSVDVEVDAYLDQHFSGVVTRIANSASNISTATGLSAGSVTNFVVDILLDHQDDSALQSALGGHPFRPGMSASVDIFTNARSQVVCVPIQAVAARQEEEDEDVAEDVDKREIVEVVFIVEGDKVHRTTVKTGIQDYDRIEITEGLTENQRIVTGPYDAVARKLKDGSLVKAKE